MKKYWYYTFKTNENGKIGIGHGLFASDEGYFDLSRVIECLIKEHKAKSVVIDSWNEISTKKKKKMQKFFAYSNK